MIIIFKLPPFKHISHSPMCFFLTKMLVKRQETEQEMNQTIQKLNQDKQSMQDHITGLSRNLSAVETQKTEMERTYIRLEKDKSALRKTLDKVGNLGHEISRLYRLRNSDGKMVGKFRDRQVCYQENIR